MLKTLTETENNRYPLNDEISVPGLADRRYAILSITEVERCGYRVIGGDLGDVYFEGFDLDHENNRTVLYNPVLVTGLELTVDEATVVAQDVVSESFESIGLETVEHS